jgi:hypothetical protein
MTGQGFDRKQQHPCAAINRPVTLVPLNVPQRFLSGFLLPLTPLRTISFHEPFDDPHVAVEIAPAAQVKLFRLGNEYQNV